MRREQVIKMVIFLAIIGIVLFFGLDFYFNNYSVRDPAQITVNMVGYKTSNVTINLPKVSGDEKIASIFEKENSIWKQRADANEIKSLNISTTYYDENYISILYNGIDSSGNKIISSKVIDLVKKKEMGKGEIVDVALKSKFEAEGREDPKMRYPDNTFAQFDYIYLEKGTDGTVNCVFCWKNKGSGKYNTSKMNGFEIIKSIV